MFDNLKWMGKISGAGDALIRKATYLVTNAHNINFPEISDHRLACMPYKNV